LYVTAQFGGASGCDRQHLFTEVNSGQPNILWVRVEIEPCTDGHFEDLTAGLRAGPLAPVAEQHPLHELHPAVVAAGLLVPVAMPTFSSFLCLNHSTLLLSR